MKILVLKIMVLTGFLGFLGCRNSSDPQTWSDKKINKWFEKGEWLNGWTMIPDASVDKKELALSYFKNKERWDKAFTFLRETDLKNLELKRYDIDGDNLFAQVSEYVTKNPDDAKFEAHRKYIDIQYVIEGKEMIGLAPLSRKSETVVTYDATNDIEFMYVTQGMYLKTSPVKFYIFFPSDAHSPGIRDGDNSGVRKIVVKVKAD